MTSYETVKAVVDATEYLMPGIITDCSFSNDLRRARAMKDACKALAANADSVLADLADVERLRRVTAEMQNVLQEFCQRRDDGEIRSNHTYMRAKHALSLLDAAPPPPTGTPAESTEATPAPEWLERLLKLVRSDGLFQEVYDGLQDGERMNGLNATSCFQLGEACRVGLEELDAISAAALAAQKGGSDA